MSLICGLGFHNWVKSYLSLQSCAVYDRCTRCGRTRGQAEIIHIWESIRRNHCLTQQVCKRCGIIGQNDEKKHKWVVTYKYKSYEIVKKCKLCGVTNANLSRITSFIGQDDLRLNLMTTVIAARKRGEMLPHILLCGESGMGKVTLAKIIAAEMEVNYKIISANATENKEELAAILTNLRAREFLIIEQFETLHRKILETLRQVMEEFSLEINVGKGSSARTIKLNLPHFTIIGICTDFYRVDKRLSNMMFPFTFKFYPSIEIAEIISMLAAQQDIDIDSDAVSLLADQCNGNPREALLTLKNVHKYAIAVADGKITSVIAQKALVKFGSNKNSTDYKDNHN